MHLTRFRVRKFRNIVDSGDINVTTDVTCLVGWVVPSTPSGQFRIEMPDGLIVGRLPVGIAHDA